MRSMSWLFILTCVISSRVAFASDKAEVNIPFSFETHGKVFPAGKYDVTLKGDRSFLSLTSRAFPADTITWTPVPTGIDAKGALLSVQFDQVGNVHELHAVRMGQYQTLVLDTHLDRLRNSEAAQSGQ
jgi:hypothetical protein